MEVPRPESIPDPAVRRLSLYLRQLEAFARKNRQPISSKHRAKAPTDNAQDVADEVVGAGVRGLLNFAPVSIGVPAQVAVSTVDVAVHLEQLSFQVNVTPAERAG